MGCSVSRLLLWISINKDSPVCGGAYKAPLTFTQLLSQSAGLMCGTSKKSCAVTFTSSCQLFVEDVKKVSSCLSWTSCPNFPSGCKHIVHSCKHHSDSSAAHGTCMASPWWLMALSWWSSWKPSMCPAGVGRPGNDVPACLCVHKPPKSHQGQAWMLILSPQFLVLSLPWLCFITWTRREPVLSERSQTSGNNCHNVDNETVAGDGLQGQFLLLDFHMTLSPAFCIHCW